MTMTIEELAKELEQHCSKCAVGIALKALLCPLQGVELQAGTLKSGPVYPGQHIEVKPVVSVVDTKPGDPDRIRVHDMQTELGEAPVPKGFRRCSKCRDVRRDNSENFKYKSGKCRQCDRDYAQEWTKNRREKMKQEKAAKVPVTTAKKPSSSGFDLESIARDTHSIRDPKMEAALERKGV